MPLVLIRKFWPFTVSGRGCIIPGGGAGASAMAHRMFGSGSSFRVGWRTAGGLVLAGIWFGGGTGRWAGILRGLGTFLVFPNFLGW